MFHVYFFRGEVRSDISERRSIVVDDGVDGGLQGGATEQGVELDDEEKFEEVSVESLDEVTGGLGGASCGRTNTRRRKKRVVARVLCSEGLA